jgi:hypothetical protein
MRHSREQVLPLFFAALLFAGCDAIHERLTGPYILTAVDVDEQLCVARESGGGALRLIGPVITDAGFNRKYIVAAVREPGVPGGPQSFYYLDMAKDSEHGSQFHAVSGPFSKDEFEKKKREMGLPEFTRHFPKLR